MKRLIYAVKDWYLFGKEHGFRFAAKYQLGLAKEGKDFYDLNSDEKEQ